MNYFERFLYFLQGEMTEPSAFGWFHCMCLILMLGVLFYLCKIKKDFSDKQLKIVLGVYGIIALILEILKQLIWSFNYNSIMNSVTWNYQWYAFPFQLCTTPIFISIICLFLKNGKIRTSLLSYMAFVTIMGSIATMLLPDSCFVKDILVNVHTMWLHLGSFVVSVYLVISGEVKINLTNFKRGIVIFLIFVFIAEVLNITIYNFVNLKDATFNMFYISPYFNSTLPVFNIIQSSIPFIAFLIVYVVLIILGSYIIYLIFEVINNIFKVVK